MLETASLIMSLNFNADSWEAQILDLCTIGVKFIHENKTINVIAWLLAQGLFTFYWYFMIIIKYNTYHILIQENVLQLSIMLIVKL